MASGYVTVTVSVFNTSILTLFLALMGHLVNINCMGYINSYGIFQAYYTKTLHLNSSTVAWIGSVQLFLLCFVGTFSGRALDAGYYRHVLLLGCFLQLLGIFSVSFAHEYWQIFLAQGVCQGLGNGLVFCPTLSLVSTYFSKHRTLGLCSRLPFLLFQIVPREAGRGQI